MDVRGAELLVPYDGEASKRKRLPARVDTADEEAQLIRSRLLESKSGVSAEKSRLTLSLI